MKDSKIRKLVMAALLAALTYVATTVIKIPTPTGGYVHPGDGMGMGAAAGIPSNLVQAVTGIVIALVLVALLKGSKALDKIAVQW